MKDLIYLDANYLVALFVEAHPLHTDSIKLFNNIDGFKIAISYLVIDEVIYVLTKYKFDRATIKEQIGNFILMGDFILVGIKNEREAATDYIEFWGEHNLNPRDAMHLFIMRQNNIKIIASYDDDFITRQDELGISVSG